MIKKIVIGFFSFICLALAVYFIFFSKKYPISVISHSLTIGDSVDSFNGVTVYNNGSIYGKTYGKHYTPDSSYYYGKKWQCVEFIKRYYYDYLHHKMPNGYGHAHSFFNKTIEHGKLNKERGLIQFKNGGNQTPKVNDLLVFDGEYGHVAIVSKVSDDEIEVVQQNIYMTPRQTFVLKKENNCYTVGEKRKPLGWLRLKQ
jgi:surface antigen